MNVIDAILNRKSIRYFRLHLIPQDEVKILLECARFAPSGGNRQPWEFVVVDDPADIAAIYDHGWTIRGGGHNVCRFADASLLVLFLGGPQCYIAAENMALAAYGLGYGSCMIGAFDHERTKELLGIPEEAKVPVLLAIGVADEERSNGARFTATGELLYDVIDCSPNERKPISEIVHHGRYGTPYAELEPGRVRDKLVGGFKTE